MLLCRLFCMSRRKTAASGPSPETQSMMPVTRPKRSMSLSTVRSNDVVAVPFSL